MQAAGTGPEILVAAPSLANGTVQVPVWAWLPASDAYSGLNIHLRWDPAVFSFSGASATGGVFDPGASTGYCATNTATYDGDGGGVVFACAGYAGTTTSYHLLATISLTPAASGCSALHLFTYGGADNGDANSGTFTVNAVDTTPQSNTYVDGTADVTGHTCTPPGAAPAPAPAAPTGGETLAPTSGNCVTDVNGDGYTNILDLSQMAAAFLTSPGSPRWNSAYDLNADDNVNILDMSLGGASFEHPFTGCAPEYPYFNPGPSWQGNLPNGYNSSQYLIFTGAMVYSAGSYSCSGFPTLSGWAFDSPVGGGYLSACGAVAGLSTLADDIGLWDYAHGISWTNQVFVGPNDCMSFFLPPNSTSNISAAAGVLHSVLQIATSYAQQQSDHVEFTAVVDDEGYVGSCDPSSAEEAHCSSDDVTFFLDYAGPIGPAGAPRCTDGDEETLSTDGGGPAIPQVYVYSNPRTTNSSCNFDGYGPATGSWPYAIASGYAGVQTYPIPSGFYTSWEANIRWDICHGAAPLFDFDWSYPGGRG